MKKTILIDARHSNSDFTLDIVWAGLVDKFGSGNIIDWPPAPKHREGIPKIVGHAEKDYGSERRSMCYTPGGEKHPTYTVDEINSLLRTGQVERIFIDERDVSYGYYVKTIAPHVDVPVVVIAGCDRFDNDSPRKVQMMYGRRLEAMFLDNWIPEYDTLQRTFPMSYAVNFDHLWDTSKRAEWLNDKVYDICFMGYNSHGDRAVIIDHLMKKYGAKGNCLFVEKRPNTFDSFVPKREYFKMMAQSKICINVRGAASCGKALRFYEIPYVGSFMLSQTFGGKQVAPFEDNVHCKYFGTIDEMDRQIEWALSHPQEREVIASAGHRHFFENHTPRARIEYMYGKLK